MEIPSESGKKFNFGPIFQKWVRILYTEPEAVIKNNGWLSESFNMSRGIRQGCPLSALLFIFAVEIMSTILRDDSAIKGIEIKNPCSSKTYKISQYADDSVIILEDTDQIAPLLGRMKQFGKLARLKLNLDKTKIMLLGTLKGKHKNVDNLECIDNIKSLGIYVGHDREYCIERNWTDKINKIESMLKMWRERSLTLLGKILIIKALALPLVSFVALNCYTPDWIVKALSKIFFNFVWGNTAKVKKNTLTGNFDQGGLKMIEVGSYFHALKASWIRRLCNANKDDTWAYIPTCILKKLHVLEIIDLLSEPNISRYKSFKHIPTFYKQVIEGYIHGNIKHDAKTDDIDIKEICIWGNKQILNKNNEILYFTKWIESGIITVSNLKIIEGKICN